MGTGPNCHWGAGAGPGLAHLHGVHGAMLHRRLVGHLQWREGWREGLAPSTQRAGVLQSPLKAGRETEARRGGRSCIPGRRAPGRGS